MKRFGFQWHLTNQCNGRCRHCYQHDYSSESECDFEQLYTIADKIFHPHTQQRISINLTGGEPLLIPHLDKLIAYLHGFDNLDDIQLITNATIRNQNLLQTLPDYPKLSAIKISLESADPAVHDRLRGIGNFHTICTNIDLYKQWSQKPILLMMTLSRYNLDTIEQTISFAKHIGIDGIIFERFVPLGRGTKLKAAALRPRDWHLVLKALSRLTNPKHDPYELLPYHAFYLSTLPETHMILKGALCNLGPSSMALLPDATVLPCRRLPVVVGNLRTDSFPTIINRLESFGKTTLENRLLGSLCGMCGIDSCIGCRAMALALTGDVYQDDPSCPLLSEKP